MLDQKSQPLWLRFSPHIIAQVGITALAVAYYAEIIHALEPCILCIYQRVPFALVIAFGLVGMFRPALLYWMLVFAGVAFLAVVLPPTMWGSSNIGGSQRAVAIWLGKCRRPI